MTILHLLHAQADTTCAQQIRTGLTAQGYRISQEPRPLSLNDPANPSTRAGAILACAAVILVWSADAAQSTDIVPHLPLVQQLTKPVYALLLDHTPLPQMLTPSVTLTVQVPYTQVLAQLTPHLPSQQSTDALFTLYEKAVHEYISVRKEAIALASEMLQHGEKQVRVRAVLEYLASKDTITSVREMALNALLAEARTQPPSPQPHTPSHIVEISCPSCGHMNHFDKHIICKGETWIYRGKGGGSTDHKRELYLECKNCKKYMVVSVDCRGYE